MAQHNPPINKIAISTGGGDAPGLNAVIRAVVLSALNRGWECVGIRDGYNGLMLPEQYPDGGLIPLDRDSVRGITHLGGTILGTTNRDNPLKYPTVDEAGRVVLGHLLRGGTPTTFDRLIALRFGAAAVRALEEGQSGVMVALDPPAVHYVPLEEATRRMKTVPLDCDTILTARDLGLVSGIRAERRRADHKDAKIRRFLIIHGFGVLVGFGSWVGGGFGGPSPGVP